MPEVHINGAEFTRGQLRFWNATDPYVMLSGGYGAGKTQALALKFLQLVESNWGTPGLILAPTWRTMKSTTFRRLRQTLRKALHPSEMPKLRDPHGECYLDFGNDAPIFLRSANNVDSFDGLDVGWLLGDEARYWKRDAWNVAQGRVRVKCPLPQVAIATTPAMGWLSDEFDAGKKGRRLIIAPTSENAQNLAPGFIDNLKESYSARLWKALIEGLFTILEGAVYEDFDVSAGSPWLVDFDPHAHPMVESKVYLAVDPGYRRSSWHWIVQKSPNQWVVFDSMSPDNRSDLANVRDVNARGWPIDEIWVDPAAKSAQSYEGADTLQALRQINTRSKRPLRWLEGMSREIAWGVDKTRVLLGCEGHPRRVHFARRLVAMERGKQRGILKDLSSYRYPDVKDGKAVSDQPLKDGVCDHGNDSFRYWACGMWLTSPLLRRTAYDLKGQKSPGYKAAA